VVDMGRDRWSAIADKLADLVVDSATRAKVAADIREDIDEASGEMTGTVWAYMFDRMRLFVEEWRSAERLLDALGMSPYPLDENVVTEEDRQALDDLRELLPKILQTPSDRGVGKVVPRGVMADRNSTGATADGFCVGGVLDDMLCVMRAEPERWWTVRDLAKATRRCGASIYGKQGINLLLAQGFVEVRSVQSERGWGNQQVRQFKIRCPKEVVG
jgi:hypothetical protein